MSRSTNPDGEIVGNPAQYRGYAYAFPLSIFSTALRYMKYRAYSEYLFSNSSSPKYYCAIKLLNSTGPFNKSRS